MNPLTFSEQGLSFLLILEICLFFIFLFLGICTWKKASCFERVAFIAALVALFLSQVTSAVSNYNIMEHLKVRLETMGMVFDDGSERKSDNTEETPIDFNDGSEVTTDTEDRDSEDLENISVEEFVASHPEIIFKDDIFDVELKVRNVTTDEQNDVKEWGKSVDAGIGDEIEYQIYYRNTAQNTSKDVMVIVSPPSGMDYVSGSTVLYNSNHKEGIVLTLDSIATEKGINIGGYNVNGNAYVRFHMIVTDKNKVIGTNRLIMWAKVINKYQTEEGNQRTEALLDSADVYVERTE